MKLPHAFGRYLLQERIGGGGMAAVYRATFSVEGGFEKEVAVKVIRSELSEDPQFIQMFLDEARLSGYLSHPNIVQTFDFGQVGGTYYLAMELIRGRTLSAILETFRSKSLRLGSAASLFVAKELARALNYAHRLPGGDGSLLGIVHRDVSPQNVLITREGDVKLVDFGIAKAALRSQVTQPGRVRGKCSYMAPEQARGMEVDARADVFALGTVLWECLVGRRLFEGPSDAAVLLQVIEKEIPPPSFLVPGIPPAVDEAVLRLLSRVPSGRPNSGQAYRELADLAFRLARSPDDLDLVEMQQRLATASAAVSKPEITLPVWRSTDESRADQFPWPMDPGAQTVVPGGMVQTSSGEREELPLDVQDDATLTMESGETETRTVPGRQRQPLHPRSDSDRPGSRPGKAMAPVAIASGIGALVAILAMITWNPLAQGREGEKAATAVAALPGDIHQESEPSVVEDPEPSLGEGGGGAGASPLDGGRDDTVVLAGSGEETHLEKEADGADAGAGEIETSTLAMAPPRPPARKRAIAKATTRTGQLVLSTRLPGSTVTIDGGRRQHLLPHAPLSLEAATGKRKLVFRHEERELRCAVQVSIQEEERVALLFDLDGVGELKGRARLPLPCL